MLNRLSSAQLAEWQVFEELEPFPEERADWNAARIVQVLSPTQKPLKEFMLPFGDYMQQTKVVEQPLAYQEMLIDSWIFVNNAIFAAAPSHG